MHWPLCSLHLLELKILFTRQVLEHGRLVDALTIKPPLDQTVRWLLVLLSHISIALRQKAVVFELLLDKIIDSLLQLVIPLDVLVVQATHLILLNFLQLEQELLQNAFPIVLLDLFSFRDFERSPVFQHQFLLPSEPQS